MEVLDAYVDASGDPTTKGEKIFTINGCLSTPSRWNDFHDALQTYLRSENFRVDEETGNCVFHTATFKSGRCKWMPDGLSPRDRQRICLRVAKLIRDHTLYRFGFGMHFEELERLEEEFPHVKDYFGSTGIYLSNRCFEANLEWTRNNGYHTATNYMFEQGDDFLGEMRNNYIQACKQLPSRDQRSIGDFTVGDKRKHSALQAADFVAWHSRNYFRGLSQGHLTGLIAPKRPDPELMILHTPGNSRLVLKRYSDLREELIGDTQEFLDATDDHLRWLGQESPFPSIEELTCFLVWTDKDIKDEERNRLRQEWFDKKAVRGNDKVGGGFSKGSQVHLKNKNIVQG